MDRQIFSEDEVTAIIKRAVQIQEHEPASDYTSGITKEELGRIAGEVGISRDALEKAIRDQAGLPATTKFKWVQETSRILDGEVKPENFDVISPFVGANGRAGFVQLGRSIQGTVATGFTMSNFNISSRNGRTKVDVRSTALLSSVFGGQFAFLGCLFGLIFASSGQVPPYAGIGIAVAGVAAGLVTLIKGTIWGHKKSAELTQKITEALADELHQNAGNLQDRPATQAETETLQQRT